MHSQHEHFNDYVLYTRIIVYVTCYILDVVGYLSYVICCIFYIVHHICIPRDSLLQVCKAEMLAQEAESQGFAKESQHVLTARCDRNAN